VDFEKWITSVKDQLSGKQYYILRRLNSHQDTTIKVMAEVIGTTTRTIERNIAILKDLGLIERIGTDIS